MDLGSQRWSLEGLSLHCPVLQPLDMCGDLTSWKLNAIENLVLHLFSSVQLLSHVWLFAACPSPTPGACSNACPSSRWCHLTISFSVVPFSCLQSFPASGSSFVLATFQVLHGYLWPGATILDSTIMDQFLFYRMRWQMNYLHVYICINIKYFKRANFSIFENTIYNYLNLKIYLFEWTINWELFSKLHTRRHVINTK